MWGQGRALACAGACRLAGDGYVVTGACQAGAHCGTSLQCGAPRALLWGRHRSDAASARLPLQVMPQPLSMEDGTLTRTMKPRRAVIQKVHAAEVTALTQQLRG